MQPVEVRSAAGMNCARCDKRAAFLSPVGPLCPTDALLAAAFHDWIPEQIRRGFEPKRGLTPSPSSEG
jgi:hypothetical protein